MFYAYVFALVLGGIMLAASLVTGEGSGEDGSVDSGPGHGDAHGFFAGLLGLRFATFTLAAFGLSGLLLEFVEVPTSTIGRGLVALVFGLGVGGMALAVLRKLAAHPAATVPSERDYVGKIGRVLVAVGRDDPGKLRIELGGVSVDVLARPADDVSLAMGEDALIVEMQGPLAMVTRFDAGRAGETAGETAGENAGGAEPNAESGGLQP